MQNKPIVIACFVAVLAACGFLLFGPAPGKRDHKADIEKTMKSYVGAFASGDGKAACEQLTDAAREAVKKLSGRVGARDCADAMVRTREIGGREVTDAARRIKVHKVRIKSGVATVELRAGDQDSLATFEKVGEDWKIASLPTG